MVSAASATPTSSRPVGGPPPALNPKAGEWPPVPGRYRMVNAVNSPHSTNHGTGHHAGAGPPKKLIRQPIEDELLDRRNQGEESVRNGRDGNAQKRREHQRSQVRP